MRSFQLSRWFMLAAVLIQLMLTVQAQGPVVEPSPTPTATTPKPPTTSNKPPPVTTTTVPPVIPPVTPPASSTTLSTLKPIVPSSSIVPSSIVPPVVVTPTLPPVQSSTTATSSSTTTTSSTTSISPSATPTRTEPPPSNNTPIIVGSVVGGVVGLALIGGILACINRRGGCTKRRDTKKSEFEDYGLGDFPHHRTPVAAAAVATSAAKPISPTLPRLNDQGNYYNENPNYGHYGYQENNMDYGMQPQQGYYYPQQQQHHGQQEYYDDGNYYYDSNTSGTAYSNVSPMQQHPHTGYVANNTYPQTTHQDVYKPDDVGPTHNR